jgi:hypothetical protein
MSDVLVGRGRGLAGAQEAPAVVEHPGQGSSGGALVAGLSERLTRGVGRRWMVVTGWRGTGKTGVALATAKELEARGVSVVFLRAEAGSASLPVMARRMVAEAVRWGAGPAEVEAWLSALTGTGRDLELVVATAVSACQRSPSGAVAVVVDDAHFAEAALWRALAAAMKVVADRRRILVIAVGLPGVEEQLDARGISFDAEWLAVGAGGAAGGWSPLVGARERLRVTAPSLPEKLVSALALEESVGSLVGPCSVSELAYLRALAAVGEGEMGEGDSGRVARDAGYAGSPGAAKVRESLVARGLVVSRRRGWVELAVPGLREYLLMATPAGATGGS